MVRVNTIVQSINIELLTGELFVCPFLPIDEMCINVAAVSLNSSSKLSARQTFHGHMSTHNARKDWFRFELTASVSSLSLLQRNEN